MTDIKTKMILYFQFLKEVLTGKQLERAKFALLNCIITRLQKYKEVCIYNVLEHYGRAAQNVIT